ncbi:MAG: hypothetical protein A2X46_04385 [Lentisphaerae bacterium GWF2_57_35]|nr:MAG: hypothetical protein A2X46_04385 [Lentisphaerae bacterium GWF2_57_35]
MKISLKVYVAACWAGLFCCLLPQAAGAVTRYVVAYSVNPSAPYLTVDTAARSIQTAVNASSPGDEIYVLPGTYAEGGAVILGQQVSNRVVLTNSVTVIGLDGADYTTIVGGNPAGESGIRCVYMTAGSQLIGFTVMQGGTRIGAGSWSPDYSGGGIFMDGGGSVSDCTIYTNMAGFGAGIFCASGEVVNCRILTNIAVNAPGAGGGVYCAAGGQVSQCTIQGNRGAYGGGVFCDEDGLVEDCSIRQNRSSQNAGGVFCASNGLVRSCQVSGNYAFKYGGGSYCWKGGDIRNALVLTNMANQGGGVYLDRGGQLQSCTVSRNSGTTAGGGLYSWFTGAVWNTIIYQNSSGYGSNYACMGDGPQYSHSCLAPLPINNQEGCFASNPNFERQGNYRLSGSSPCIDKGTNQAWMLLALDMDRRPRIWINTVDIGAIESNPANLMEDTDADHIPDAWEWQYYGHVTNVTPFFDSDGDACGAFAEFIAGTDPHSASSFFGMANTRKVQANNVLTWPSVEGRVYTLHRTTNLMNEVAGAPLAIDLPATPPLNCYTDALATARCNIYILRVKKP